METATEQTYKKLLSSLEDLTKSYRTLLDLVRKEKELLIGANREKLEENNQLKEAAIFKLRAQDSLRSRYATELATQVKADVEQPRLLDIAKHIAGAEGDRLRSMHAALDLLIKRITEINKENEIYAQSALKSLGGALNDIKETLSGGKKTYARKGQSVKLGPDTAGHFVSKEA
jgi:hypothetical protein